MQKRTKTVIIKDVPIEYADSFASWGRINSKGEDDKVQALARVFASMAMLYSEHILGKDVAMEALNRECSLNQVEKNPTFHEEALKPY